MINLNFISFHCLNIWSFLYSYSFASFAFYGYITNSQSDQLPKYDLFIMRVNMRFYLFAMLCTGPHEYFSLDNFVTCLTKTLITDSDYVENKFTLVNKDNNLNLHVVWLLVLPENRFYLQNMHVCSHHTTVSSTSHTKITLTKILTFKVHVQVVVVNGGLQKLSPQLLVLCLLSPFCLLYLLFLFQQRNYRLLVLLECPINILTCKIIHKYITCIKKNYIDLAKTRSRVPVLNKLTWLEPEV